MNENWKYIDPKTVLDAALTRPAFLPKESLQCAGGIFYKINGVPHCDLATESYVERGPDLWERIDQ